MISNNTVTTNEDLSAFVGEYCSTACPSMRATIEWRCDKSTGSDFLVLTLLTNDDDLKDNINRTELFKLHYDPASRTNKKRIRQQQHHSSFSSSISRKTIRFVHCDEERWIPSKVKSPSRSPTSSSPQRQHRTKSRLQNRSLFPPTWLKLFSQHQQQQQSTTTTTTKKQQHKIKFDFELKSASDQGDHVVHSFRCKSATHPLLNSKTGTWVKTTTFSSSPSCYGTNTITTASANPASLRPKMTSSLSLAGKRIFASIFSRRQGSNTTTTTGTTITITDNNDATTGSNTSYVTDSSSSGDGRKKHPVIVHSHHHHHHYTTTSSSTSVSSTPSFTLLSACCCSPDEGNDSNNASKMDSCSSSSSSSSSPDHALKLKIDELELPTSSLPRLPSTSTSTVVVVGEPTTKRHQQQHQNLEDRYHQARLMKEHYKRTLRLDLASIVIDRYAHERNFTRGWSNNQKQVDIRAATKARQY